MLTRTREKMTSQVALGSRTSAMSVPSERGRPDVTFSSRKDLHGHLTRTVTHNAPSRRRAAALPPVKNSNLERCDAMRCIAGSAEELQHPWVMQGAWGRVRWANEC